MIKHYKDLTPSDKARIMNKTKWEIENIHNVPWSEMERKMQAFLDAAYDDKLLPKMSPDDLIDAGFCRKEFKTKPDMIDFLIWHGLFVAHNDFVDVPDDEE